MCQLVEGTEDKPGMRDVRAAGPYHFMGASGGGQRASERAVLIGEYLDAGRIFRTTTQSQAQPSLGCLR